MIRKVFWFLFHLFSANEYLVDVVRLAGTRSRRRGGGGSRRSVTGYHSSLFTTNPRAAGGSTRSTIEAFGNSYSHIQTVSLHHPSLASPTQLTLTDPALDSSEVTSFVSAAQVSPATLTNSPAPTALVSPGDLPSTPKLSNPSSFAAKARAAATMMLPQTVVSNSPIDDDELLPRSGPISLGAFTKFKPASRSRGSKFGKTPDSPKTPLHSAGVALTPTEEASKGEDSVYVDPSSDEEEPPTPSKPPQLDKGKGRMKDAASPHPLREQITIDETASEHGSDDDEGVLLSPSEWNPNLPSGLLEATERDTLDRYVKLVEEAGRPSSSAQDDGAAHSLTQDEGSTRPLTQEEVLVKLGVQPRLTEKSGMGHTNGASLTELGVRPRLEDRYGGGQIRQQEVNYDLDRLNRATGSLNLDFRFPPQRRLQSHPSGGAPSVGHGQMMQTTTTVPQRATPRAPTALHATAYHGPLRPELRPQPAPVSAPEYYSTNREALLKNLHGIAVSSSARATNARTVMYDPAAAKDSGSTAKQAQSAPSQRTVMDPFSAFDGHASKDPITTALNEIDLNHPRCGPSEPLPWKDRPVEVFEEDGPPRTHNELRAAYHAMCRRIATAYGHDGPSPVERRRAAAAAAEKWFKSSAHDETHAALRAYLDRLADVERRPSPRQTPIGEAPLKADAPMASDVANTLLVPLLATINGYLSEDPHAQHNGAFGSFAGVPEWCVDTSRSGLTSFFGEDWGAPPARVGRDPRYRPVAASSPRLGGFEEAAAGLGMGMGSSSGGEWGMWARRYGRQI